MWIKYWLYTEQYSWEKSPKLLLEVSCCYRGMMDVHALTVPSQAIRSVDTDEAFWLSALVLLQDREAELSPLLHLYLYSHNVSKIEQNNWKYKSDFNTLMVTGDRAFACFAVDPSMFRVLSVDLLLRSELLHPQQIACLCSTLHSRCWFMCRSHKQTDNCVNLLLNRWRWFLFSLLSLYNILGEKSANWEWLLLILNLLQKLLML